MATKATAVVKDGNLVITVPMNDEPTLSGSGKTHVVASTRGNVETELQVEGCNVVVGVNAYIKGYKGKEAA